MEINVCPSKHYYPGTLFGVSELNSSKIAKEKKKVSSANTITFPCFSSSAFSSPSEKELTHPRRSRSGTVSFNQSTVAVSHRWPLGILFPEYMRDCYPES